MNIFYCWMNYFFVGCLLYNFYEFMKVPQHTKLGNLHEWNRHVWCSLFDLVLKTTVGSVEQCYYNLREVLFSVWRFVWTCSIRLSLPFFLLFVFILLFINYYYLFDFFLYCAYSRIWAQFFKCVKHRGGLIHEHGLIHGQIRCVCTITI